MGRSALPAGNRRWRTRVHPPLAEQLPMRRNQGWNTLALASFGARRHADRSNFDSGTSRYAFAPFRKLRGVATLHPTTKISLLFLLRIAQPQLTSGRERLHARERDAQPKRKSEGRGGLPQREDRRRAQKGGQEEVGANKRSPQQAVSGVGKCTCVFSAASTAACGNEGWLAFFPT